MEKNEGGKQQYFPVFFQYSRRLSFNCATKREKKKTKQRIEKNQSGK